MGREGLRGKGRDQGSGVRDQGSGDEEQRVVVAFSGAGRAGGWSRLRRFFGTDPARPWASFCQSRSRVSPVPKSEGSFDFAQDGHPRGGFWGVESGATRPADLNSRRPAVRDSEIYRRSGINLGPKRRMQAYTRNHDAHMDHVCRRGSRLPSNAIKGGSCPAKAFKPENSYRGEANPPRARKRRVWGISIVCSCKCVHRAGNG